MKSSHKQDKYTLEQSYALLYEARDLQLESHEQRISNLLNEIIKQVEEQILPISKGDIGSKVEGIIDDLISLQAEVDDRSALRGARYSDGIIQDDAGDSQERVDMDPEEVVENLKRLFRKHPEVERIYHTNMDAFGEITPKVVASIAEELSLAGYSTGFILQNTGIDPDEDEDLLPSQQLGPINSYE